MIKHFNRKYFFLSNFYECPVFYEGLVYNSTEAAFQAAKILYGREYFTRMNPPAAKKEGRRVDLRDDWEDVKMGVMYDVCYAKFAYNPELKKKLLKTGDKHLEEANHHGDMIWGTVDGEGENNLGKILMQIRKDLADGVKSDLTGFKSFDLNKLENIISYIADKVDNLYKTSLNKYLFYIDFLCYKENSLSITGLRYVKEQFGPVIEQKGYEDIINVLNNKIDKSENFGYDYSIITKIKSKKNYDISTLKDYEIKVIDRVIDKLNNMNCTQISQLSHEEAAWKSTSKGQLITYDYADDLLI